jgi:hypothetical protein
MAGPALLVYPGQSALLERRSCMQEASSLAVDSIVLVHTESLLVDANF